MKIQGFLFAMIVLFVVSCSSYEKPKLKELSSVKINVKNKFTKLSGTLIFANENTESMGLNEIYFDAFFNGKDVGSFTKKTDAIIPAQGQVSLPFYLEINNNEYDSDSKEIELTLKGYVNGKIKDQSSSLSFDERKVILLDGKPTDDNSGDKSKEELKQEKKEQKKLEKEHKKNEEIKRRAAKGINS